MADTPAPSSIPRPGGQRRRRAPPKRIAVEAIEQITPRLIGVRFTGEELAEFTPPRPGAHIKLLFVPDGQDWSPADTEAPRPPSRTYTPRRFDAGAKRLDVEFVLHGDGLAAGWVQKAKVGDELFVGGPGGGYDVPEDAKSIVMVADDTAMPAAGMILESLPAGCDATVFCEVIDAADEHPLSPTRPDAPHWLHRAPANAVQGTLLEQAVRDLDIPDGAYFWIACEAAAMRRIKKHLIDERGVEPARLHTRGYWRLGETNYPDHDYGDEPTS